MRKKGRQMDMQNDKLIANSFDFSNVSFSLEEVPCSVQPLSFDESLCIGCGTCARVCQCDILFPSDKKGTHPICRVSGRMLLLRCLRNGLSASRCNQSESPTSQPRKVCADYFTLKNHPLPIIKSVAGDSFLFHF